MKVGVPKEVKNHEYRVAITPVGVHELVANDHEVVVQKDAGVGSSIPDAEYVAAGATIIDEADDVWAEAEMVLKVKEPVAEEYHRMREGQLLFTYLHLAADLPLTEELIKREVTAIAYETVQLPSGGLPLLYPMSEVAGCLAPQVGAHSLMKAEGGRGVLMGGVGGVANAKVVIIGAGVSGQNAANIALGMGADVTLLDTDLDKLRMSFWRYNNRVHGLASSQAGHRAAGDRGRPGDRGRADPRGQGAHAGQQRAGVPDEAGLGARGHRGRPGRLLRGHPRHDARRSDVHGAQLGVLLRRQHARRRAEHLDLRADQRDAALHGGAGPQGLAAGLPRRPLAGARASTPTPARLTNGPVGEAHGLDAVALEEALA